VFLEFYKKSKLKLKEKKNTDRKKSINKSKTLSGNLSNDKHKKNNLIKLKDLNLNDTGCSQNITSTTVGTGNTTCYGNFNCQKSPLASNKNKNFTSDFKKRLNSPKGTNTDYHAASNKDLHKILNPIVFQNNNDKNPVSRQKVTFADKNKK
jgi:hypothetical protein